MPKRGKHGNIPVKVDGIKFDSGEEAMRYLVLKDMRDKREISCLRRQVTYNLEVNGQLVCKYIADFEYIEKSTGELIVEDVKGRVLPVYVIKKKLMKAIYGIEIREVSNGKIVPPGRRKRKKKSTPSHFPSPKKKR